MFELIDDLRDKIWPLYNLQLRICCASNAHPVARMQATRPPIIARPKPRHLDTAVEIATDPRKVILLFDQDGHPVVPTCAPRAGARSGRQGCPKATAKRRLGSLTGASTTAPSPQKDNPQNHPHRRLTAVSHRR